MHDKHFIFDSKAAKFGEWPCKIYQTKEGEWHTTSVLLPCPCVAHALTLFIGWTFDDGLSQDIHVSCVPKKFGNSKFEEFHCFLFLCFQLATRDPPVFKNAQNTMYLQSWSSSNSLGKTDCSKITSVVINLQHTSPRTDSIQFMKKDCGKLLNSISIASLSS